MHETLPAAEEEKMQQIEENPPRRSTRQKKAVAIKNLGVSERWEKQDKQKDFSGLKIIYDDTSNRAVSRSQSTNRIG